MDIVDMVASAGGTLGLAVFAIWMLNKVWQDRLQEQKQVTEEVIQMRVRTQACVEESARVVAANTEVLRANTEVMKELVGVLRKGQEG